MDITLRALEDGDLDQVFAWERDPEAVALAAFTRADPSDRAAFDRHYDRIRADPTCTVRAVERDGAFVGTIGSFTVEGEREVTYWVDPSLWGRGIASAAGADPSPGGVTWARSHSGLREFTRRPPSGGRPVIDRS